MPEGVVKVDRSTRWGNPVALAAVHGDPWDGEVVTTSKRAVEIFLQGVLAGDPRFPALADIRANLPGKRLACWCAEGSACHVDALLALANEAQYEVALQNVPPSLEDRAEPAPRERQRG